ERRDREGGLHHPPGEAGEAGGPAERVLQRRVDAPARGPRAHRRDPADPRGHRARGEHAAGRAERPAAPRQPPPPADGADGAPPAPPARLRVEPCRRTRLEASRWGNLRGRATFPGRARRAVFAAMPPSGIEYEYEYEYEHEHEYEYEHGATFAARQPFRVEHVHEHDHISHLWRDGPPGVGAAGKRGGGGIAHGVRARPILSRKPTQITPTSPGGHMRARIVPIAAALAVFAAAEIGAPGPAEARQAAGNRAERPTDRITLDLYLDWETVADPQVSPDGRQIVYTRRWVDKLNDRWESSLWIMNADGSRNRHLIDGSSPRWSPDGSRIAFLARGEPSGTQIFVRWMDDEGAVTQITRLTEAPSNITWSPDGRYIAFTMLVPKRERWNIDLPARPRGARWTEDPIIETRLNFRRDRQGWLPQNH